MLREDENQVEKNELDFQAPGHDSIYKTRAEYEDV